MFYVHVFGFLGVCVLNDVRFIYEIMCCYFSRLLCELGTPSRLPLAVFRGRVFVFPSPEPPPVLVEAPQGPHDFGEKREERRTTSGNNLGTNKQQQDPGVIWYNNVIMYNSY